MPAFYVGFYEFVNISQEMNETKEKNFFRDFTKKDCNLQSVYYNTITTTVQVAHNFPPYHIVTPPKVFRRGYWLYFVLIFLKTVTRRCVVLDKHENRRIENDGPEIEEVTVHQAR